MESPVIISDEIYCVCIDHGSTSYKEAVALRDAILRKPLGLAFSVEELAEESDSLHLGCYQSEKLVGCLVLKPINPSTIQMRQVAVDPTIQGKGIGRRLVAYSEKVAQERGYKSIMLHAREAAVPFYLKLNYQKRGERFMEVGIPHYEMNKDLVPIE